MKKTIQMLGGGHKLLNKFTRNKEKHKKAVGILSILLLIVLIIGGSFAFYNWTVSGSKNLVINAGVLDLVLEEENAITISDALPMHDEVGMIQEPYTFRLVNNSNMSVNYKLKLVKINADNELELSDVKYGFTKEEDRTIDLLSNLTSEVIDEGIISASDTINYSLRLWIRDGVTDDTTIAGKNLSYKLEVEVSQRDGTQFAVSFDSQGGKSVPEKVYMYGDIYGELPIPVRNGYTFNGWYTSSDELVTPETVVGASTGSSLYAKWNINTYSVTINPNGGTWSESTGEQQLNIEYKSTSEIEDATRVGYTFSGWEVTGRESEINNNVFTMGYENSTLTAKWKINTYKLTVNPNGGTWNNSSSTQEIDVDYLETKEIENPKREGYTFTGWSVSEDSSSISTTTFTMGHNDTTLTANWVVNDYPWIVYHYKQNVSGSGYTLVDADTGRGTANFGSQVTPNVLTYTGFKSPASQTITIQVDEDDPPTKNKVDYNYARNKYTLTVNPNGGSWNSTTSNSTFDMYYEATKTIANPTRKGYKFNKWTLSGTGSSLTDTVFKMGTANTTLTSSWTANTYTIKYNANGGSGTMANQTATYDSAHSISGNSFKRTGYTFAGWTTNSNGTDDGYNWTGWSGTWKYVNGQYGISSNTLTLYARWTANTYTVSFNANGGSVSTTSKPVTYASTYGTLPTPTRTGGYTFNGWFTAASGGTQVTSSTKVSITANQTLYAQWTAPPAGTYILKTVKPTGLVTSTTYGGMYRFQGTSANNYICFGTSTKSTCTGNTDRYMYRILGITSDGQLKLVKKEALNTAYPWSANDSYVLWNGASLYSNLNSSYFYSNTTYVPTAWKSKIALKTWKYGDLSADCTYNGVTTYTTENALTTSVSNYIGLMHVSDVLLAYSGGNPGSHDNVKASWIFLWASGNDAGAPSSSYEWLILRKKSGQAWLVNSKGYVSSGSMGATASVRPVFYISSASFLSGTGALSDPFIIS